MRSDGMLFTPAMLMGLITMLELQYPDTCWLQDRLTDADRNMPENSYRPSEN
jgi:hypothetical protein